MSEDRAHRGPPHLRHRSTAAVVLTRPDPRPGGGGSMPADRQRGDTADVPAIRRRRWPTVLTWIVLGAAIMALWALLLLGDSLVVSG